MNVYNIISAFGILFFVAFLFLFSRNRKRVSFRVIFWGIGLQLVFALFVFRIPFGAQIFLFLNDVTMKIIDSAFEGIRFLFGPLAMPPGEKGSIGFILAFQAFPSIIFFRCLNGTPLSCGVHGKTHQYFCPYIQKNHGYQRG